MNYSNPLRTKLENYSKDELYQLVIEELPHLRKIAEEAAKIKKLNSERAFNGDDNGILSAVNNNLSWAVENWENCIGSQLDARNG